MIARLVAGLAAAIAIQPPAPPRPDAGTAVIRGRVLRADGRPLPRAIVQIAGVEHRVSRMATTTADGRFEFTALAADAYAVTARRPGYLPLEYGQRHPAERGQRVTIAGGEMRERIDIVLPRNGAITGRVSDENGDPVEAVTVRVLRVAYVADRRLLLDVPFAQPRQTNDVGRYRVYGLPPGQYVVAAGVGLRAGISGYGYSPAFFPGTPSPGDAQFVAVDVSQDVSGIDLTVRRVRTVRVRGIARDSAGQSPNGGITLGYRFDSHAVAVPPVGGSSASDGSFEFAGVPPGEYVLQAFTRRPAQSADGMGEGEFASRYLTVADRNLNDVSIVTSKGSTVRGRVAFDGDTPRDVSITAFPVDFDVSPNNGGPPSFARPRIDGTFELTGLHGPRRLTLFSGAPQWSIASIRVNGLDVTDAVLPFGTPDQSLEDVEVTLTTHAAEIAGAVLDARGQPVGDGTVIVYATDVARWYRNSRFMKFVKIENAGAYRISGLPPGEYFVAAVDRMEGTAGFGEWQDPAVLEALMPRATRVTLADGQRLTLVPRVIMR